MEKSNNIHIIVQVLHTHCVCSIDKSTDYSRNSTLTTATGYYIVIVLLWFPSSAHATSCKATMQLIIIGWQCTLQPRNRYPSVNKV